MEEKLYNLGSLKEIVDHDREEIIEMLEMFLDLAPATLAEMQEAYQEQNYEELGKLAHKLKSSLRLMEINVLEPVILAIEKDSKEKRNLENLDMFMNKLNEILPKAIRQIRENEMN